MTSLDTSKLLYCGSRFQARRRDSRAINVGGIYIGGNNPIRIQSMTTTKTQDIDATVAQTLALAEAGCEIVRITAPNKAAAAALGRNHQKSPRREMRGTARR
jgi:(E)-4-hydroxy-3-methylbut-2-enyl-diphosphate synthase